MSNVEELLQCFDELGNPSEVRTRKEVKTGEPRWWCGVATIWLVNDAGEIMVSRRSESVSANPGKWQSFFGGHVQAGKSFRETAQSELAEETGLSVSLEDLYFVTQAKNDQKKVFSERFVVRFNGSPDDLRFVDGEISDAKWMDMKKQWELREADPETWCNGCAPEQQEIIISWLSGEV